MIQIENVVLPSPKQWEAVIRGMRNPMNSWNKSDSGVIPFSQVFEVGDADLKLMENLSIAGATHSKYRRMIPVYMDITAPLYWWKEFDTYKVGTVANSCSTMHKIQSKEFDIDDFSIEHLNEDSLTLYQYIINRLNKNRGLYNETKDKEYWWQMIQILPSSFNQRRTVLLNYEVLSGIYHTRKYHKLDEWVGFCKWIETLPYFEEIINA